MNNQEKFEYWLKKAQEELNVAKLLFENSHWLYIAFMCQQSVEKLAKGLYTYYLNDDIPGIHNLNLIIEKLSDKLQISLNKDQLDFLDSFSSYYINSRYSDYRRDLANNLN